MSIQFNISITQKDSYVNSAILNYCEKTAQITRKPVSIPLRVQRLPTGFEKTFWNGDPVRIGHK